MTVMEAAREHGLDPEVVINAVGEAFEPHCAG